ncbi:MAG: FAD-binding oxidoreductase [Bdellovibrionota bacterium]
MMVSSSKHVIPRGNGRSYGDSALGDHVISSLARDHVIDLNRKNQTIHVNAGMTMDRLLEFLIPRGFFPPVVPGTKYITIGGAVASDIHGKNHHKEGTFTQHVKRISVITSNGDVVECSPDRNADLFRATCGGMGLTGFIHDVEVSLKPIHGSMIQQISHRAKNLDELFDLFDLYQEHEYSVAWIDCMSSGSSFGRGVMFAGKHDLSERTSFQK